MHVCVHFWKYSTLVKSYGERPSQSLYCSNVLTDVTEIWTQHFRRICVCLRKGTLQNMTFQESIFNKNLWFSLKYIFFYKTGTLHPRICFEVVWILYEGIDIISYLHAHSVSIVYRKASSSHTWAGQYHNAMTGNIIFFCIYLFWSCMNTIWCICMLYI